MKRVLVTGASGFVGRHVLSALNGKDVHITALIRSPAVAEGLQDNIDVTVMDIASPPENAYSELGNPDVLIHLAWGGLPNYRSQHHVETELPQQFQFIKTLVAGGLPSVFSVGTCFEYGMQSGMLGEKALTKPDNAYGQAKDSLRRQLEDLKPEAGFSFTWARLFYMFADDQAATSLYPLLKEAIKRGDQSFNMSGGEQLRDYLSADEVAEIIVELALNHPDSGVVNICSGEPVSVKALMEGWIKEMGASIGFNLGYYPYPDYEPMEFWGDRSKLDAILGGKL